MLKFAPTWTTVAGDLLALREGEYVDTQLEARDIAVVQAEDGQQTFDLSSEYDDVSMVTVDGVPVSFSVAGTTLSLDAPLSANSIVEVTRAIPLRFSLLNGELPPGVSLRADGSVYGRVLNVPNGAAISFRFAARVSNGSVKRDRVFAITVDPVPEAPVWNLDALPVETFDPALGISYRPIAALRRGQAFAFTLDAVDPDAEPVITRAVPASGAATVDGVFNGVLPNGIAFFPDRRLFYGVVVPDAEPGRYLIAVDLIGGSGPLVLAIDVLTMLETDVAPPIVVAWETPPGLLGTITEAYPCALSIRARATDASGPIVYGLAPHSGPLPPGIMLDETTGDLTGVAYRVDRPLNYSFIARANVGAAFVDLPLVLRVEPVFTTDVLDLYLRLQNIHRVPWLNRYRAVIPHDAVFRPDDGLFGIVAEPCVHVVRGLDATGDAAGALMGTPEIPGEWSADHHTPVSLILGAHKVAQARAADGTVIYEMLYREIVDPQTRAGGFGRSATADVVRTPVAYPQSSPTDRSYVFPNALANIRADLVADLGFATDDAALRHRMEGGIEPLPVWMPGGYIPALPIAHLKPGMGATVLSIVNRTAGFADDGFVLGFDRYYLHTINYIYTRFDDDQRVRAVPFVVAAGQARVNLARWAAGLSMVVVRVGLHDTPWAEGADYTLDGDELVFAPSMAPRVLVALCADVPAGVPAANGNDGNSIALGVAYGNTEEMLVNGTERPYSTASNHAFVSEPFNDGDEVVFVMKETRFDEAFETTIRFDVTPVEVSKYYKLKDIPTA